MHLDLGDWRFFKPKQIRHGLMRGQQATAEAHGRAHREQSDPNVVCKTKESLSADCNDKAIMDREGVAFKGEVRSERECLDTVRC
jgi:hypothetical protein